MMGKRAEMKKERHRQTALIMAGRLTYSHRRVAHLFPMDAATLERLGPDDAEKIDAFLFRFQALADIVSQNVDMLHLGSDPLDENEDDDDRMKRWNDIVSSVPGIKAGAVLQAHRDLIQIFNDPTSIAPATVNAVFACAPDLISGWRDAVDDLLERVAKLRIDVRMSDIDKTLN